MTVSVVIAKAGPTYSGQCSQSGGKLPPIRNAPIQSFESGGDDHGWIFFLKGLCGGRVFTLAYAPAVDHMTGVTWADYKYRTASVIPPDNTPIEPESQSHS